MESFRLGNANRRSEHYARFPDEEHARRRERVRGFMQDRDLEALVVYGDAKFHASNVQYLTDYAPPFATYVTVLADPVEPMTAFAGISNHVQYVREASVVEDVRTMLPDSPTPAVERLREAGVDGDRIGLVSGDPRYNLSIPHEHHETFEAELSGELVDVTEEFVRLVSVAGETELAVVEESAALLDELMEALEAAIEPGVSEAELKGVLADACGEAGGALGATFISSAPMEGAESGEPLPWKQPSSRTIEAGDVVTTEISAGFRGYKSQIHRAYAVDAPPTDTYEAIYDVARETYDRTIDALQPGNTAADVYEAFEPLESSAFKHYDVLVHGYGSGYRHPFLGSEASNYWPGEDDPLTANWEFEPGMVIVVQPNVFTPDETAGIQFGTTVVVGEDGPEVIQEYPAEFVAV